jgi:tripartite-type tricarboxylate transporter receptor subunit TctC
LFSSSSLAEIQRGLHQPASGDEATEAREALSALSRLRPVAGVSADRTVVAVSTDSVATSFASLAERMRSDPGSRVAGIGADAASKAALAGMVSGLGLDGKVPYRVYPSGADASLALASGDVDLVVAPRSQTLAERRRGEIRLLDTASGAPPGVAGTLPGSSPEGAGASLPPVWSMLLAPPSIDDEVRRALARRVGRALEHRAWRRYARSHGIARLRAGAGGLERFLAREPRRAGWVAAMAARVPEQHRDIP